MIVCSNFIQEEEDNGSDSDGSESQSDGSESQSRVEDESDDSDSDPSWRASDKESDSSTSAVRGAKMLLYSFFDHLHIYCPRFFLIKCANLYTGGQWGSGGRGVCGPRHQCVTKVCSSVYI